MERATPEEKRQSQLWGTRATIIVNYASLGLALAPQAMVGPMFCVRDFEVDAAHNSRGRLFIESRPRTVGLVAPSVGHVGDGNFSTLLILDGIPPIPLNSERREGVSRPPRRTCNCTLDGPLATRRHGHRGNGKICVP